MTIWLLFLVAFVWSGEARAYVLDLPQSIAHEVLSESVPTAFAPNDFDVDDFTVESTGLGALQLRLEEGSLQWVRAGEVLVLPRARLEVRAAPGHSVSGGRITSAGFSQEFAPGTRDGLLATITVALISGSGNPITVAFFEAGGEGAKEVRGMIQIHVHPRHRVAGGEVSIDSSCTRFGVTAQSTGTIGDEWTYVGCRLVSTKATEHRTSSLEILVFWDGAKPTLSLDGAETEPVVPLVWAFRERSEPGYVDLASGDHHLRLNYSVPEVLHYGSLGAGLGPYLYDFDEQSTATHSVVPLLTVYGSYFVTETMRVVAFDATSFNSQMVTDFGVYLNTEEIRSIDRRFVVNLMLGAHVIGFGTAGQYYLRPSAPQGIEATFADALFRGYNATVGGFIYPEISGRSYYNIWLRYGSAKFFVELNYITWRETVNDYELFSRSMGISLGIPLLRFL